MATNATTEVPRWVVDTVMRIAVFMLIGGFVSIGMMAVLVVYGVETNGIVRTKMSVVEKNQGAIMSNQKAVLKLLEARDSHKD